MNFVIISTYYKHGGAELQAIFEKRLLEQRGHKVLYLTFDPDIESGKTCECGHINIRGKYSESNKRNLKVFIDVRLMTEIQRILRRFNTDVIHMHNITYGFPTIALASRKYETLQTIHDYSCLCDKDLSCIYDNMSVCDNCSLAYCRRECFGKKTQDKIVLLYRSTIRRIHYYYRRRFIKHIISPSLKLCDYLNNYGYNAKTINNALDVSYFTEKKKLSDKRIVLMYGAIREDKGIYRLLEVYNASDYKNIKLEIVGPLENDVDIEDFNRMIQKVGATYYGAVAFEKIVKKLQEVYAVIIPSVCIENYPNVALEGIYTECVVCGSNRGGIPELITDKRLLFDVLKPKEIVDCLHFLDEMDSSTREEICKQQMNNFSKHNTPAIYLESLGSLLGERI